MKGKERINLDYLFFGNKLDYLIREKAGSGSA